MARLSDVVVTPADVVRGSTALTAEGTLGATATAGQVAYEDDADLYKLKLADANASAPANTVKGILLNGGAIGQPAEVQTHGLVTIGTLVKGKPYFLSAEPGGICPWEDLVSGCRVVLVGIAFSTTQLDVRIIDPGVTL